MQKTPDDHQVQEAWNVLDRLVDENEFLREENQKLLKKIENLKKTQHSFLEEQQESNL